MISLTQCGGRNGAGFTGLLVGPIKAYEEKYLNRAALPAA